MELKCHLSRLQILKSPKALEWQNYFIGFPWSIPESVPWIKIISYSCINMGLCEFSSLHMKITVYANPRYVLFCNFCLFLPLILFMARILLVSKYGHIQLCDIAEACSLSWKRIEAPLCRLLWLSLSLDCRLSTTVHIHFAKMTKCGCRQ